MTRNSRGGRARRRRIGFILANIHTGSGNTIWPALVDEAESRQVDLLLFPGGRLSAPGGPEASRNSVFALANPRSVDGLLSWASAIGGFASPDTLERLHASYGSLPTITLNQKIGDLPLHTIDSYSGMRSLMAHLLDAHGFRRIAYVQGPATTHPAAKERYQAFRDSLKERGILLDSRLVTPPFPWDSSTRSIVELLDERDLHPGRDFDILVAASDLLLYDTVRMLQSRGYRIPDECPVAGFNDSMESRMLSPAFTTVRMPFVEQSVAAFHALLDLLDGKPIPRNVRLPTRLIIRQSCGCTPSPIEVLSEDPRSAKAGPGLRPGGRDESLIADVLDQLQGGHEDRAAWIEPLVNAFRSTCRQRDPAAFLGTFQRLLTHVMQMNREIHVWQDVVSVLRKHHYADHPGGLDGFMEDLFHQARLLVSSTLHTAYTFKQWHDGRLLRTLGDMDKDLLAVRDRGSISGILCKHLPALDIASAYVVLYEQQRAGAASVSRLIAGFRTGRTDGIARPLDVAAQGEAFPSPQILPGSRFPESHPGCFMVQPLTIDDRAIGYVVLRVGLREGYLYEEIRGILSSALNGVFLLEETGRARETAERAEQLKSRFLVNVSGELRTPVRMIDRHGRSLATLLGRGGARDLSRAQTVTQSIRELARRQLRVTDDLLDLALTQVQDLPLRRVAADPLRLLREAAASFERETEGRALRVDLPPRLPLIEADPARFSQILSILLRRTTAACVKGTVRLSARLAPPGLDISIAGRRKTIRDRGKEPFEGIALTLAGNLAVLHGGVLSEHEDREKECGFVLHHPLPTLGEVDSPARMQAGGAVLVLSSGGIAPPEAAALESGRKYTVHIVDPRELLEEPELLFESPTLLWDAASSGFSDWSFTRVFRRLETCLRLPCAIYPDAALARAVATGCDLGVGGLIDAVSSERLPGPVIVLDADEGRREVLVSGIGGRSGIEEIVAVGSVDQLMLLIQDCTPSLVLLNNLDEAVVRRLRSIPRVSRVPLVLLTDVLRSQEALSWCADMPNVAVYNRGILSPVEIVERIQALRRKPVRMLPPHTSALVKKAIVYINLNGTAAMIRWKLADAVSVSEDYLSRVFHREAGMSPWEYLKRFRILMAGTILTSTSDSIKSVAAQTGFRDSTYFCRVFRSVVGLTPREYRAQAQGRG